MLEGFIVGYYVFISSNDEVTKFGLILDNIDTCMPDLTSPYLAFKDKTTTRIMYR
jgi:hypothetical protein